MPLTFPFLHYIYQILDSVANLNATQNIDHTSTQNCDCVIIENTQYTKDITTIFMILILIICSLCLFVMVGQHVLTTVLQVLERNIYKMRLFNPFLLLTFLKA